MRTIFEWLYRWVLRADIRALEIHHQDLTNAMRVAPTEQEFLNLSSARARVAHELVQTCATYKSLAAGRKTWGVA